MTGLSVVSSPRAHPRSRGENIDGFVSGIKSAGSSPLTRGKHPLHMGMVVCIRLIPAHAGKTQARIARSRTRTAHPRSRGENGDTLRQGIALLGSSPLTRGKPASGEDRRRRAGLIPAHAGKTVGDGVHCLSPSAHPRSRGENDGERGLGAAFRGSSPLTRGKQPLRLALGVEGGLIPAHAGKTKASPPLPAWVRAHPRSRGENDRDDVNGVTASGSSPLTRGKRRVRCRWCLCLRLIPAHAGKTLPDLRFYCADRSDLGNP